MLKKKRIIDFTSSDEGDTSPITKPTRKTRFKWDLLPYELSLMADTSFPPTRGSVVGTVLEHVTKTYVSHLPCYNPDSYCKNAKMTCTGWVKNSANMQVKCNQCEKKWSWTSVVEKEMSLAKVLWAIAKKENDKNVVTLLNQAKNTSKDKDNFEEEVSDASMMSVEESEDALSECISDKEEKISKTASMEELLKLVKSLSEANKTLTKVVEKMAAEIKELKEVKKPSTAKSYASVTKKNISRVEKKIERNVQHLQTVEGLSEDKRAVHASLISVPRIKRAVPIREVMHFKNIRRMRYSELRKIFEKLGVMSSDIISMVWRNHILEIWFHKESAQECSALICANGTIEAVQRWNWADEENLPMIKKNGRTEKEIDVALWKQFSTQNRIFYNNARTYVKIALKEIMVIEEREYSTFLKNKYPDTAKPQDLEEGEIDESKDVQMSEHESEESGVAHHLSSVPSSNLC